MHSPHPNFIMTREFLLSIPTLRHREAIEEAARGIRAAVYTAAVNGKTKISHKVGTQNNGCITDPPPPIVTTAQLVTELIRTLEGCRVTHVSAEKGEYGYNRPESIEIDWS